MVVACKLLGQKFFRNVSEEKSKIFKRSIFVVKNIKKVKSLIRQTLEEYDQDMGWSQNITRKS